MYIIILFSFIICWLHSLPALADPDHAVEKMVERCKHEAESFITEQGDAAKYTRDKAEQIATYCKYISDSSTSDGHGDASAQLAVGNAYHSGWALPKNDAEAVKWWDKAAERCGSPAFSLAQHNLGNAYRNGEGVPHDYGRAYMWLTIALEQASWGGGGGDLSKLIARDRESLAKSMTLDQIAEAQRLAKDWTRRRCPADVQKFHLTN
jgi:TPR repeat protein